MTTADPYRHSFILLNSFGTTSMMWAELRAALAGSGVGVITTELPGHYRMGDAGEGAWQVVWDHYVETIALAARRSLVHLCGVSWGGSIAIELAAALPEQVATVTSINAPVRQPDPTFWTQRADAVEANGMGGVAEGSLLRMLSGPYRASNPDRTAQLQEVLATLDPRGYAQAARILADVDVESQAGRVRVPALVLASEHDEAVAVQNSHTLADLLRATIRVHPDAGHLLPIEEPRWVADELQAFAARAGTNES